MNGWSLLLLIALSLSGLGYLARTDPKRRRVHRLPPVSRRRFLWPARLATFAPGALLIAIGHWSGLMIWAGAVTTLGWVLAAIPPARYAALAEQGAQHWTRATTTTRAALAPAGAWLDAKRTRLRASVALPRRHSARPRREAGNAAYIAALEARIVALEARLMRLEATGPDDKSNNQPTAEPDQPTQNTKHIRSATG